MAIKPRILMSGDTIGIVTLGSPLDPSIIQARISFLQGMGFKVVVGQHVYDTDGYLAGTDEERASDLMRMFLNPSVKLILPSRGGVGVAGILPYLNYNVISQHPKIVSGYSDVTILLNVLNQYANLITFHSLLLIDFRAETPSYNFNQFYRVTASVNSPKPIHNPPGMPLISRVSGNVTGPVVGGNLTSFVDCLGTPFEIDTRGKILLIEDTHAPINTVYRYVNHLKLAGKFDDCIGILLGECTGCTNAYGKSYEDLIDEFFVPLGKPLMTNLATAHGVYKAAIPIGARINMNTDTNMITIMESTVSV